MAPREGEASGAITTLTAGDVRRRLEETFRDDADLDAFIHDHFKAVYAKLTAGMTRVQKTTILLQNVGAEEVAEALARPAPAPAIERVPETRRPRIVIPVSALPRRAIVEAAIVGVFLAGGIGVYADMRSKITGLEKDVAGTREALTEKINGSEKRLDEKVGGTDRAISGINARLDKLEDRFNRKFGADSEDGGPQDMLDGGEQDGEAHPTGQVARLASDLGVAPGPERQTRSKRGDTTGGPVRERIVKTYNTDSLDLVAGEAKKLGVTSIVVEAPAARSNEATTLANRLRSLCQFEIKVSTRYRNVVSSAAIEIHLCVDDG